MSLLAAGLRPCTLHPLCEGGGSSAAAAATTQIWGTLAAVLRNRLAVVGTQPSGSRNGISTSSSSTDATEPQQQASCSSATPEDALRASSGAAATTSSSSSSSSAWASPSPFPSWFRRQPQHQHHHHQQQLSAALRPHPQQQHHHPHAHDQARAYRGSAKHTRHPLPAELQAALDQVSTRPARPAPPPLEPRPIQFTSRRAGAIAIKAGMTQEWDEFGARVPLTVLWIDECQVVRHKTAAADGTTALVLGCGSKKEKQLHGRQVGEFNAAGASAVGWGFFGKGVGGWNQAWVMRWVPFGGEW